MHNKNSFNTFFRYIERGLVDTVRDDPKTLKLRFEPSKRTSEPDGYYTKPKENKCVVCGSQTNLRRKNVVPSEYKKNFQGRPHQTKLQFILIN